MRVIQILLICSFILASLVSPDAYAKKKVVKGVQVEPFPTEPSIENLYVRELAKKVKKVDTVCFATFATSFIHNAVVQVRARTLLGDGKLRKAAGRRLINVTKETRQAITDEAYAYARTALADAGFMVKSDADCMAMKNWDKFKVSNKDDGELKEMGIFSGTMKIPTGATHAARHSPTGRPDYSSLGASPLGDTKNQAAKSITFAKKHKIGLVDFSFALDFNVNSAMGEVRVSVEDKGNYIITTTSKSWDFDFTDVLFVSASGASYVDPNFKTAMWYTGPQYTQTFPAIQDTAYITGFEENNTVWDKRINAVNYDLEVDQARYKEIYLRTLRAYIDVYVARMAALKPA